MTNPSNIQRVVILARVSTRSQGDAGNGIEHQLEACREFSKRNGLTVVREFIEIGSGGLSLEDRPVLKEALAMCEATGARLVLNKLSRLSRKVSFVATLLDDNTRFFITEMGFRDVSTFELNLMSSFAQMERELISKRTIDALKIVRRTKKLGGPNIAEARLRGLEVRRANARRYAKSIAPIIQEIKDAGVSTLAGIARCLNARGFTTPRGKSFYPNSVRQVQATIAGLTE